MKISWIDILVILLLVYNIIKGFNIGFIKSVFGIVQFMIVVYVMKRYYPYFYGYVKDIPILYNVLQKVFQFLLSIIFYERAKTEPDLIEEIMIKGAFNIFLNIIFLIIFYILIKWILTFIFKLISYIFETPILNQMNKIVGVIFGLIKGALIIYILFIVFNPIIKIYPEGFIGKGMKNSILFRYLKESNIIYNLFSNKIIII